MISDPGVDGSRSPAPAVEDLVARAIRALEDDSAFDLERFLEIHAEHAQVVREQIEKLQSFGALPQRRGNAAPQTFADGARIAGRYSVLRSLGRGGMGNIILAHDATLERDVAIKLPAGASAPDALARFAHEARILGRLEHPNIVPVHDLGRTEDGRPFFAMRAVAGTTLHDWIVAGREPGLARRVQIAIAVCDAIAFAHARGVVHRDLKPHNVMLGPFGEVQVLDWGLAKERGGPDVAAGRAGRAFADPERGMHVTADGHAFGTPSYCAPEQARGEVEAVDELSDVFGLGAILHHLLGGRPLYYGATRHDREEVLERARNAQINDERFEDAPWKVPQDLIAVCRKATAARKEDRYRGAAELRADLQAFLDGRAVTARAKGPVDAAWRWIKRRPALAMISVLAMIALGLLVSLWIERKGRERDREEQLAQEALELPALLIGLMMELESPSLETPSLESEPTTNVELSTDEIEKAERCARALDELADLASDLRTIPGAPRTVERLERWQRNAPEARAALLGTLQILLELLPSGSVPKHGDAPAEGRSPDGAPLWLPKPASASDQLLWSNLVKLIEECDVSSLRRAIWRNRWLPEDRSEPALIEALETVVPEDPVDYLLLARMLNTQGHFDRARGVLEAAERANLHSWAISFNRGWLSLNAFRRSGSFADAIDAIASYKGAVDLAPAIVSAHSNLGVAYVELAGLESRAPSPERSDVVRLLWQRAREQYEVALDLEPESARTWFNLGCLEAQRPAGTDTGPHFAEICFQAALTFEPKKASAWESYAALLWDLGPPELAAEVHRRWMQHVPPTANAHDDLAQVLDWHALEIEKSADRRSVMVLREEASFEYQAALALDPTRFKAWTRLASLALRMEDYVGALDACEGLLCCGRELGFDGWSASEARDFRRYEHSLERNPLFQELSAPLPAAPWRERGRTLHARLVELGAEIEAEVAAATLEASR